MRHTGTGRSACRRQCGNPRATDADTTVQDLVVWGPAGKQLLQFAAVSDEAGADFGIACLNMKRRAPEQGSKYRAVALRGRPEIAELLKCRDFRLADFPSQQYAIWTLTDNPPKHSFRQIETKAETGSAYEFEVLPDVGMVQSFHGAKYFKGTMDALGPPVVRRWLQTGETRSGIRGPVKLFDRVQSHFA